MPPSDGERVTKLTELELAAPPADLGRFCGDAEIGEEEDTKRPTASLLLLLPAVRRRAAAAARHVISSSTRSDLVRRHLARLRTVRTEVRTFVPTYVPDHRLEQASARWLCTLRHTSGPRQRAAYVMRPDMRLSSSRPMSDIDRRRFVSSRRWCCGGCSGILASKRFRQEEVRYVTYVCTWYIRTVICPTWLSSGRRRPQPSRTSRGRFPTRRSSPGPDHIGHLLWQRTYYYVRLPRQGRMRGVEETRCDCGLAVTVVCPRLFLCLLYLAPTLSCLIFSFSHW